MKINLIPHTTFDIEVNGKTIARNFSKKSQWKGFIELQDAAGFELIIDSSEDFGSNLASQFINGKSQETVTIIKASPTLVRQIKKAEKKPEVEE